MKSESAGAARAASSSTKRRVSKVPKTAAAGFGTLTDKAKQAAKEYGKAATTTKQYDAAVRLARKWLTSSCDASDMERMKGRTLVLPRATLVQDKAVSSNPKVQEEQSEEVEARDWDSPEFRQAFNDVPNVHSARALAMYLTFKIFDESEQRSLQTADKIRAAFIGLWDSV
jgi:hypothetical protein